MKYKVMNKQNLSENCFVCGTENEGSLKTKFYELENRELMSISTPSPIHRGYPDRIHGGIISSILDEIIGRAIVMDEPDTLGVTIELKVTFKKPVPIDKPIKAFARITQNSSILFEGTAEIILEDGSIAATGYAKYYKIDIKDFEKEIALEGPLRMADLSEAPIEVEI